MKKAEVLKRQAQLLKEVDFLANKFTQNERKEIRIVSIKNNIQE